MLELESRLSPSLDDNEYSEADISHSDGLGRDIGDDFVPGEAACPDQRDLTAELQAPDGAAEAPVGMDAITDYLDRQKEWHPLPRLISVERRCLGSGGSCIVYPVGEDHVFRQRVYRHPHRRDEVEEERERQRMDRVNEVARGDGAHHLEPFVWARTRSGLVGAVMRRSLCSLENLASGGRMRAEEVLFIAPGCVGALTALHKRGIAHDDVRLANVMIRKCGCPALIDFDKSKHFVPPAAPAGADPGGDAPAGADAGGDARAAATGLTHMVMAIPTGKVPTDRLPLDALDRVCGRGGFEEFRRRDEFAMAVVLLRLFASAPSSFASATVDDVVATIKRQADAHLEGGEEAKGAVVEALVALVKGEPVDVARLRGVRGFEEGRRMVLARAYAAAGRPPPSTPV